MGFIPRRLIKQDLNQFDVLVDDIDNIYFGVQDVPGTLVQGRSAIKLTGSDFLKENVPLKIEILDAAGETVYNQPVRFGYTRAGGGNVRPTLGFSYLSIEVYNYNAAGRAELTILGELDPDKVSFEIPEEFQNTYNVKFTQTLNIDPSIDRNESPILFYRRPKVTVREFVRRQLVKEGDISEVTRVISGSGIFGLSLSPGGKYIPLDGQNDPGASSTDNLNDSNENVGADDNITTGTNQTTDTSRDATNNDLMESFDEDGAYDKVGAKIANSYAFKTGEKRRPAALSRVTDTVLFASPPPPNLKIFATGSNVFNAKMAGGQIRIPKGSIMVFKPSSFLTDLPNLIPIEQSELANGVDKKLTEYSSAGILAFDYTGSIERVKSGTELHCTEPFYFGYSGYSADTQYRIADFGNHPYVPESVQGTPGSPRAVFTASYIDTQTATTGSHRFDSFMDFNIKNTRTFSGDVYRIKVLGMSQTSLGDMETLLDTEIESPEKLIDLNSASGVKRTGYFQTLTHTNIYWITSSNNITMTYGGPTFIDSLQFSGSYGGHKQNEKFNLRDAYKFEVDKDVAYTLTFNAKGKKGPKTTAEGKVVQTAKMTVHLSGSNLVGSQDGDTSLGREILNENGDVIGLQLRQDDVDELEYGTVSTTFKPNFKLDRILNTDTILQFKIESGEWEISDVSLQPAIDTGFSPDQFKLRVPIPKNTLRPDKFTFLIQYFDINNNKADRETVLENIDVSGSALVIEGQDNMLSGSLFLGNVQGSGIELHGGSAYLRAIGYTGFKNARAGTGGGFFLWSGSASPGGVTQDNYTGAGLEIHDGNTGDDESFLKFRTIDPDNSNNSTLEIKTSKFFLGNDTQFISGSNGNLQMSSSTFFLGGAGNNFISGANGNIEIKSSNFHLQNDGDVIMQGQITAEAGGTIGGWDITANAISDLNASGKGIEIKSDPSTPIITIKEDNSNKIELFHTTSDNFGVKGTVSGNTIFQLGSTNQIAGWSFSDNFISSSNLLLEANEGRIRSKDYNPRSKGWVITADGDGFAEFGNIHVRGTLSTTVFEKEQVNVVGGQLWVANSSVITSSVSPTSSILHVENVSGFSVNEVIFAQKVTGTGFTKEYMKITSSSRTDLADDNDMTGILFVTRSFGNVLTTQSGSRTKITEIRTQTNKVQTEIAVDTNSGFLNDRLIEINTELMKVTGSESNNIIHVLRGMDGTTKQVHAVDSDVNQLTFEASMLGGVVSPAESYDPGQVIVSTGKFIGGSVNNTTGSGWIEMNANVNRGSTPYMDFKERTGSGVYDWKLRTRVGDLSGLVGSALGDSVAITNTPGFGLASENVFLSGLIKATSGSIGGIIMESNKIFTGAGAFSGSSTGFFADSSGRFSLKNKISYDDTTSNLVLNPDTFDLNTTNLRISSSNRGVIAMGGPLTTGPTSEGVFISGFGDFNFQTGSSFLRGTSAGLSINFPSFSVDTSGIVTATQGNFSGDIRATSGFFGTEESQGWNIDSNKIKSVVNDTTLTGSIEIDATPSSPNITLTSGSFFAEILPDFTPGSTILAGGGNTFSKTGLTDNVSAGSGNNRAASGSLTLGDGATSGKLNLFAGFDNATTADINTASGSVTLAGSTANKTYKSSADIRVQVDVNTPNHAQTFYNTGGSFTITGTIKLIGLQGNVINTTTINTSVFTTSDTSATTTTYTRNIGTGTITHNVGSAAGLSFKVENLQITNNNIEEDFFQGGKAFSNDLNITSVKVFYTSVSHQPSNKKTEIAPAGFQTVLLEDSTIGDSANRYFRAAPGEPVTVDMKGIIHMTGSVHVADGIAFNDGSTSTPAMRFKSDGNTGFFLESADDIGVSLAGTEEFRFGNGGHFHADNDITAFSNTVSSDYRLKENILPLKNNLNKILLLKPSSFKWKVRDKQQDVGLIAQDVEKVIPEVVKDNISIGITKDFLNGDNHKTVDYAKLTTHLIGAIQEQQKQIDELKKKIEEL